MQNSIQVPKGIESLRAAVQKDTEQYENCFNPDGCDKERTRMVPQDNPKLVEMGIKEKCIRVCKCSHDYCGKFKWVMDRAKMYADFTGKTVEEVVEVWEKDRTYWYMNYYQECKQPALSKADGMKVLLFDDWVAQLKGRFGDDPKNWKFQCVSCKHVQSGADFIAHGIEKPENKVYFNCIGRYVTGIGCNWTLGGLFQLHKTVVIKDMQIFPVFEMAEAVANLNT